VSLSGEYAAYDAVALSRGELRLATVPSSAMATEAPSFLANYETLMPNVIRQIRLVRFFFAPLEAMPTCTIGSKGQLAVLQGPPDPVLRTSSARGLRFPPRSRVTSRSASCCPANRRSAACPRRSSRSPSAEELRRACAVPDDVRQFVESTRWTFAKTTP